MKKLTLEQFHDNWDEMIGKVEEGEAIQITNGDSSAIMAPIEDEMYRIHTVTVHRTIKELSLNG